MNSTSVPSHTDRCYLHLQNEVNDTGKGHRYPVPTAHWATNP